MDGLMQSEAFFVHEKLEITSINPSESQLLGPSPSTTVINKTNGKILSGTWPGTGTIAKNKD